MIEFTTTQRVERRPEREAQEPWSKSGRDRKEQWESKVRDMVLDLENSGSYIPQGQLRWREVSQTERLKLQNGEVAFARACHCESRVETPLKIYQF